MPGLHVTDRQVRRYMTSRREGQTQAVAAAQAGFSERTGRRIEAGPTLPSQKPPRAYRTRADSGAADWARASEIPVTCFREDWEQYGRQAGPLRNTQMLAEGRPDAVIAFPGGKGTADMVRKARAAGLPVVEARI